MKILRSRSICGAYVFACVLLSGCASEILREPTTFSPGSQGADSLMIVTQDFDVSPPSGYSRKIKKGSTWKYVGRVPRGRVYAIEDDVFMLEGKHMHEANCVVGKDAMLTGFYLPAEQAFVAISPPVRLPVNFK
jgi:hypothetical protein